MAFCFNPKRSLSHEFRRIAEEELDTALKGLNAKDIHLARSRLKRVRALLGLLDMDEDATAAEEERTLRDAGRYLSETRDIEVCLKVLGAMARRQKASKKPLPAKLFEQARKGIKAAKDPAKVEGGVPEASRRIALARQVLSGWLPNTGWKSVRSALHHSYQRCRRALEKACSSKENGDGGYNASDIHRLRKRLKALWFQLRLLSECCPKGGEELMRAAERLSDLLGREHDLIILRERLIQAGADASLAPLFEKIAAHRANLDRKCLALAERFLARKPDDFVERMFG